MVVAHVVLVGGTKTNKLSIPRRPLRGAADVEKVLESCLGGGQFESIKKQLYEELFQGSRQAPSMMKARSSHKNKTLKGKTVGPQRQPSVVFRGLLSEVLLEQ